MAFAFALEASGGGALGSGWLLMALGRSSGVQGTPEGSGRVMVP